MRFNNEPDKGKYVGEIEFLTKEEWFGELEALYSDILGEDGKIVKKPDPKSQGAKFHFYF